jgi:hypothetical protein
MTRTPTDTGQHSGSPRLQCPSVKPVLLSLPTAQRSQYLRVERL